MIRIEYIPGFVLLLLIVIAYLLYRYVQSKNTAGIGNSALRKLLTVNAPQWSPKNSMTWFAGLLVLLTFAIANPQWGHQQESVTVASSDIYLAIDISNSMNTQDIAPSRIERAKKLAEDIMTSRKGDRIGLILFAGSAYLQMPLTNDLGAAITFVRAINTQMAGTQGTAIGSAIKLATRNLQQKTPASRALIILSDGEDHEEDATDAAEEAADLNMKVFTIGVGTDKGGYIPMIENNRDGYKMDENGEPVLSKVNFEALADIAASGGGKSYDIEQSQNVSNDIDQLLDASSKEIHEIKSMSRANSYYWIFAFGALLLILTQLYGLKTNFLTRKQS